MEQKYLLSTIRQQKRKEYRWKEESAEKMETRDETQKLDINLIDWTNGLRATRNWKGKKLFTTNGNAYNKREMI